MQSYLTQEEIERLQSAELSNGKWALIRNVSQSIFSVARFSGGARIQGESYTYLPQTDELIRDDILKLVTGWRKEAQKAARKQPPTATQDQLFGGENKQ